MARNTGTGEQRDTIGLVLGIVLVFALGVYALAGTKTERHTDFGYALSAFSGPAQPAPPPLPKVTRPGGQ